MESVKRTKFKNLSAKVRQETKSCIICFENFNQADDVINLNCHERHIFHEKCIEQWMKSDTTSNTLQCPVCRKSVVNNPNPP